MVSASRPPSCSPRLHRLSSQAKVRLFNGLQVMHFLLDKANTVLVNLLLLKSAPRCLSGLFLFYGVRQPCCRFSLVLAGLATRFASDPFVSYIS